MDLDASARACNFEENNNEEDGSLKRKDKNKKPVRASAKKAMDEMQAIQSEQQRLHREASISIPYHKPKKHTLQDFLNRRTIIKPEAQNSSPIVEAVRSKNLKMTQEELEEYAKLMEERAKEATEFFKSESEEEEEEEVFKDNDGVIDKPMDQQNLENNDPKPATELTENNSEPLQLTEEEMAEILAAEEQQETTEDNQNTDAASTSKVLITEVIELPKLDMNTVKISPVKKPPPPAAPQQTPRNSLNIKQILATKNLKGRPSLSGDPNKLIDLETGDLVERKPTGVENLMQRLMCNTKGRKSKTNEVCNILSTENGKVEITKINVSLTDEKDPTTKEPKPRAAYFELKKNLKEIIKKKRLEELNKKQEDEAEHSKCLEEDDDMYQEEEYEPESKPHKKGSEMEIDDEENPVEGADEEEEDDEEEEGNEDGDEEDEDEDETDTKLKANKEIVIDDEENPVDVADEEDADDDDEEEEEEEDDDEDSDADELTETNPSNKTKRNRIIKTFDDSDEDKDDIDFLKTQPPQTQLNIFDTQTSSKPDEESELMGLCSGTFDITQKPPSPNALMSQIPLTQNQGKPLDDDELMELCSGTFEEPVGATQQTQSMNPNTSEQTMQIKCNKIVSSDDEEEEEGTTKSAPRTKKLTKKLKKKAAKLGFSDDEEEEVEVNPNQDDENEEEEDDEVVELADDEPATFVDYDSEENEIVVQMTKKDCLKKAANFLEKEAELSESEWGSADEDEKNLDKYDIELGDEDEFDKEKLRSELEQIHARKMLDDDLREVRKIQDMLFEDEEKDGVGRQRQFKWKNAESGFSLDDGPKDENGDPNNGGDSGDELNEHQWRKIRYEREQFLKEKGLKPDSQDLSTTITNTTLNATNNTTLANTTMAASLTTKKIQIITAKKTSVKSADSKTATPFLISKGIATMNKKTVRGSFLVRDKETLNKLAGLTKGSAAAMANATDMDAAGTVSIKSVKPKNFVFATLTEEEHENMKRKADDLLNSSTENGTNFMKKPKIEPRRDKCFIDQLL
ncbi:claspin [Musca vetustissima]|uniref:claspin n=1 Tax=Musca vetustissima TaxID=27455 RepID=UPI002AB610FA|nr:claspin [Musca vetustissima]